MKEFTIIAIAWIVWFVILYPTIDNSITKIELEDEVYGDYTTDSIIDNKYQYLYSVKNLKISFKDGIYRVYYDLYANCEKYNTNTYRCIDNNETHIQTIEATGSYSFSDKSLILKIENGANRTCTVYSSSIDCSSSGGWNYRKIQ